MSKLITTLLLSIFLVLPLAGFAADVQPSTAGSRVATGDGQPAVDTEGDFDDPFADEEIVVNDPIEPFNRAMFWFNDKLYFYVLKPIARGYRIIPEPARVSVDNFFRNIETPVRLVNTLLQFKMEDSGTEIGRFAVNTTVGLLGLFDPAKSWLGWERKDEDFGQTLGYYGSGPGLYIVWPVMGPSNLRDSVGMAGDYFAHPLYSPLYFKLKTWEQYALYGLDSTNKTSLDRDTYEGIKKDALDPYLFVRDAYQQHREAQINR
ncbi:MlaA family lipoprotein [Geothermobacter hydrogeniphilus]|uniref:Phospholipid-binding lipoprotein MlaA n=1 Tax=Geothermobacter hydrogeniphilus TaxID=1969733 RepID=A0A1X0YCS5_9BACT|nr:VacJ family lipoprotein [Geothermobacter hydrogeniphilus]ORJ62927.1 hypothetical protein B5V00_02430 [Geothermobacter hydrogeniphilus]